MADELTPVTREEDYLAAIAGQDVTPPDPATRKEEWLDAIAGRVDGLAEDVGDLGDIVPAPAAEDSGKVLTAGADGTASWRTAGGGGGGFLIMYGTGTGLTNQGSVIVPTNLSMTDLAAITDESGRITQPIFACVPTIAVASPYYDYESGGYWHLIENITTAESWDVGGFMTCSIAANPGTNEVFFALTAK